MKDTSIDELLNKFMEYIKLQCFGASTLGCNQSTCKKIATYAAQKNVQNYSIEFGIEFLMHSCNIDIDEIKNCKLPNKILVVVRVVKSLSDFYLGKKISRVYSPEKKPLTSFHQAILNDFCTKLTNDELKSSSIYKMVGDARLFLSWLEENNLKLYEVTNKAIEDLILQVRDKSNKTKKSYFSVLKNFLTFAHHENIIDTDYASYFPKTIVYRNSQIPSVWNKEDVLALLNAIDRGSPIGKRNYALLLLVIDLGLRTTDIKCLKLQDINWAKNTISIMQSKTLKYLELPLLPNIGWALIDYLQNGRPITKCGNIFVKHNAPFVEFSAVSGLNSIIDFYAQKAKISFSKDKHNGMHSLRHTLASTLLAKETPLHVISEILGHSSTESTTVYLKVDTAKLKLCALSYNEVFHE